ncbi:MAG: NAD(P)H-dependent oxidoreductase [archaeon]|nr:NAD(P)H-dependent oxidoreductase [archaeon]
MKKLKIVAICGSPHKGSCYSVLKWIEEDYPDIDYKILMIKDMNLEMCRGCYTCVLKGEKYCPIKDDRDMIIKEMLDADGVIFASPTFVNHISALMKNFLDRLSFFAHRPIFFDKYAMVMSVCGGFGADKATGYLDDISSSFGFNVVSSLELKMSTKSDKENNANHEKTKSAFNTYLTGIKKGQKTKPGLMLVIMFYMFKFVSAAKKDHFKADYEYYKDKTNYYDERKISFYKKMIAKKIVSNFVKKFK